MEKAKVSWFLTIWLFLLRLAFFTPFGFFWTWFGFFFSKDVWQLWTRTQNIQSPNTSKRKERVANLAITVVDVVMMLTCGSELKGILYPIFLVVLITFVVSAWDSVLLSFVVQKLYCCEQGVCQNKSV